jgi:hypothetical protein
MTADFNRQTALRATAAAVVAVVVLAGISMVFLDHADFVDWGWLIGPAAWVISCVFGARVGRLSWLAGFVGSIVAGIPSGLATLTGVHWLGVVVGLIAFAAWTGSSRASSL